MFCLGLTGTICSGKSTALNYFKTQGIATISADQIARQITHSQQEVKDAISQHFGAEVILSDGQLNRPALRSIIFADRKQRHWLEKLLHPLIRAEIARQIEQVKSPYCVVEIPLLADRKSFPYLNRILLIKADQSIQIKRIMTRDHCSVTDAQNILKLQSSQYAQDEIADDILENNDSPEHFCQQLQNLHQIYLNFS